MVRKRQGQSFRWIARSVASFQIGVSPSTIKRWWKQLLHKSASASLWLAKELVESGWEEDLVRMHPKPVAAAASDAYLWLEQLLKRYAPGRSRLRGYWLYLNGRMPREFLL